MRSKPPHWLLRAASLPVILGFVLEPAHASRLQAVSVRRFRVPLSTVVQDIERQASVKIQFSENIAADPVSVRLNGRTPDQCLQALAEVMQYRVRSSGPDRYEMSLDPAWAQRVARLESLFAQREERDESERAAALEADLATLVEALRSGKETGGLLGRQLEQQRGVGDWIASLSGEERQSLALAMSGDVGVIGTGRENSHLAQQALFFRPVDSVSPEIRGMLDAAALSDPSLAEAIRSPSTRIGLSAQSGAVGIVAFDGANYKLMGGLRVAGTAYVAGVMEAGRQRKSWEQEAEAASRLDRRWLDPQAQALPGFVSPLWRKTRLVWKPDQRIKPTEQSHLEFLTEKGGIELVADAWTDSLRSNNGPPSAGPSEEGSVADWSRVIAQTHHRLYRAVGDRLLMRSNRAIWSRWVEPPANVVESMRTTVKLRHGLGFEDYVKHCLKLNTQRCFALSQIPEHEKIHFRQEAIVFRNERRLLTLLARRLPAPGAAVPPVEEGSVDFSTATPQDQRRFLRLLLAGIPVESLSASRPARVAWKPAPGGVELEFEDSRRKVLTRRRLTLPRHSP